MTISGRAKEYLVAFIAYAFLGLLFFKEIILQSQWFGEDFFTQNFPNRYYAAVELSNGSFPLWTPFVFSGMPFFADIQTAVLYPFNLALSLFSSNGLSYAVYEYQVVFHVILGACFMYLYLRDMSLDFASALLGGLLFAFNSFFIGHAHHDGMLHSGIWIPLVFYCCRRGFMLNPNWFLGCAMLLVVSLFGGHPQITIYIFYAFTAYFIYMACLMRKEISLIKSSCWYGVVVLLYFLLSAVQILPTVEFLQNTARNTLSYTDAIKDSLPLRGLSGFFMDGLLRDTYESWQQWEFGCYIGVGSLMLVMVGVARRSDTETIFFAGLALLALALMLGENTPIYKIFFYGMPGFSFFRVPARFDYLFLFSIAVLAAQGLFALTSLRGDDIGKSGLEKVFALMGGIFLLVVPTLAVLVTDFNRHKVHIAIYLVTAVFSLLALYMVSNVAGESKKLRYIIFMVLVVDLFFSRSMHNQMRMDENKMRDAIYQSPVAEVLKNAKAETRFLAKNKFAIYANLGLVYRRANLFGYNQFQLKLYRKLNLDSSRTVNLLGAEFIDYNDIKTVEEKWKPSLEPRLNFVVNADTMPRAFIVRRSRIDPAFDLQTGLDSGFDPLGLVYLDIESPDTSVEVLPQAGYSVARYENKGNEILIDLESAEKGFLVISEIFYPGWKAYVNNQEQQVLRADMALRAVRVEKGQSHIRLVFLPNSFVVGRFVSLTSLLGIIIFLGIKRYKRENTI